MIGTVPPLADQRVDRPADRDLADALTHSGQTVAVCQVLSGLGGVGKTQVAAALAHQLWNTGQVDLLVWVSGTSRTAILTGFADTAARITGIDDSDPMHGAARLLAWLAEPHQRRWLIVLDNLDNPDDLTGLWPPTTPRGHTVVTTRRQDTALLAGRHRIDVDVFTPDQAGAYLHSKLANQPQRLDEADQLAHDLGYLPLALAQAVAYILDRGAHMTCARYRQRLADQRRCLADLAPDALPDQHAATVAATWGLSIERADQLPKVGLARPVLELAALLDPAGIPIDLLTTQAVAVYCAARLGRPVDGDDLNDALHTLHRFSLLTLDESADTVRVHGLLQRAVRDATDSSHHRDLATIAADALLERWPPVERDAAHTQALRANTTALHRHTGDHLLTPNAHSMLFVAARSLGNVGLVQPASAAFKQLLTDMLRVFGPEYPATLAARHELAYWQGHAGDPAGAATTLEQLLADMLRLAGPNHPYTLTTRHNLAYERGAAGDPAGAATTLEQLLADMLRVLGPDHPSTLAIRANLGYCQGQAGDPASAATTLEQLLADMLRVLGPDHPHTLATRANLAYCQGQAGDPASAATTLEQLLADMLRVLGPDHPHTLTTRHELACSLGAAGDPASAATTLEQLLADMLRVLGPDHPHTLTTRDNLARIRGQAGDPAAAATTLEQLLADMLRVLGPDHPSTLAARHNLAHLRGQAGDPATAATTLEQLLADMLRVLGPDHPYTLVTRRELARWRGRAGDPANDGA